MKIIHKVIPIIFTILVICVSFWAISNELKHHSFSDIIASLEGISWWRKQIAIALTCVGYLTITGYDLLAFHYLGKSLAWPKIIFTSFLSYAIGNTIGFTVFSGTAIRYRFYAPWGISSIQIAKIIGFTHLSFWLGMLGVGGIVFIIDPLAFPSLLNIPLNSVHPLGIIFLLIVSIYFYLCFFYHKPIHFRGENFALPSPQISVVLMLVSALDWAIAAGVLYLLFPAHPGLSFPGFFGIYILALIAGIVSTVPGGLGVFETVITLLRPPSTSPTDVLGALLAYRLIYYFLPLVVAIALLLIYEWKRHQNSLG